MTNVTLPPVTVVMTTWAPDSAVGISREHSAREALRSWTEHLRYDGPLRLCVADDGSALPDFPASLFAPLAVWSERTYTRQERHGVGASLNAGLREAFAVSPIALYAVDDWALTEHLDITPWVKALLLRPDIGMVRLGPPHPDLTGKVEMVPDGWVLRCDRHHFVDGLRPFLAHQRFYETYGWYDEDQSSYETERLHNLRFCHWYTSPGSIAPDVVLALPHPWEHVGEAEVGEMAPGSERQSEGVRP